MVSGNSRIQPSPVNLYSSKRPFGGRMRLGPVHQPSLDAGEEGFVPVEVLAQQQVLHDLRRRAQVDHDDDACVP